MDRNLLIKLTEFKTDREIYVSVGHIVNMVEVPAEADGKAIIPQHTLVLSQGQTTPFKVNQRIEFIVQVCEKYSNSLVLVK